MVVFSGPAKLTNFCIAIELLNVGSGSTALSGCALYVAGRDRLFTLSTPFPNSPAASDAAINLDRVIIDRINYIAKLNTILNYQIKCAT